MIKQDNNCPIPLKKERLVNTIFNRPNGNEKSTELFKNVKYSNTNF